MEKICIKCGTTFTTDKPQRGKVRERCDSCISKHNSYKPKGIIELICDKCGKTFKGKWARFCGPKCRQQDSYFAGRERKQKPKQGPLKGTTRYCLKCNSPFEPKHQKQTYCTIGCSHHCTKVFRKSVSALLAGEMKCNSCGNVKPLELFPLAKTTVGRGGMCRVCANERQNKRRSLRHGPVLICEQCKDEYQRKGTRNGDDGKRFCTQKCAWEYQRQHPQPKIEEPKSSKVFFLECGICGGLFCSRIEKRRCCSSSKCKKEYARRYALERYKAEHITQRRVCKCKECGREFVPEYPSKQRSFCCPAHGKKYKHKMGKPGRTARKALLRAGSEQINRIKIFERDKWVCQLCGRKTLKSKIGTWHERAPEVDHIIPVSKKGRHARQNVHCTCRACNSKKGAKIKGQLRMW